VIDCIELRTHHHKGKWHGFGPIRDCERILFAVFENTKRDGSRLVSNSFDTKSLTRYEQSVGRAFCLMRRQFDLHVVGTVPSKKGRLIGVASIEVSRLRGLRAEIGTHGAVHVRALCVIDRVEHGDYDAHATIGYSKASTPDGISETRLGKLRSRIRMDLADAFSDIIEPNGHQWPSRSHVFIQRIASIIRAFKAELRKVGTGRCAVQKTVAPKHPPP
jgi:hypothetical protein